MNKKPMLKEKKLAIVVSIFCLIIAIITVSYALFSENFLGIEENEISTGTLSLTLTDENPINLSNAVPVDDSVGLSSTPYTFTVTNDGTVSSRYQISIVDHTESYDETGSHESRIGWNYIKYSYINETASVPALLSSNNGVLFEDVIGPKESKSYDLRMWIDYATDATQMNKHFYGIVKLTTLGVE